MTMFSFRVDEGEADDAHQAAQHHGISLSELLREALHRHLVRLQAEDDIAAWADAPLEADELALGEIAEWGPAEDWSDWADATG